MINNKPYFESSNGKHFVGAVAILIVIFTLSKADAIDDMLLMSNDIWVNLSALALFVSGIAAATALNFIVDQWSEMKNSNEK